MHHVDSGVVFSSGKQSPLPHFYFVQHGCKQTNKQIKKIKEKKLNSSFL